MSRGIVWVSVVAALGMGCDASRSSSADGKPDDVAVELAAPGARACESVIVVDPEDADVTFAEGVRGEAIRRGSRVGVAFVTTAAVDAPLKPFSVRWRGARGSLRVAETRCFGARGEPLTEASLRETGG